MKGRVAFALVATALIIVVGAGYIWGSMNLNRGSRLEDCTVTAYGVWEFESRSNGTTSYGITTYSGVITTFQTTGYPNTTTNYATTVTGAIDSWNGTTCS